MVQVDYKYRYVITKEFFEYFLKMDNSNSYIIKMLRINRSSKNNKNNQILFLDSETSDVYLKNNPICRGMMAKIESEEYSKFDNVNKNIIFAIDISDEKPYNVVILVSKSQLENYKNSPHYLKLKDKNINILSEEDALKRIDNDFFIYHNAKENDR